MARREERDLRQLNKNFHGERLKLMRVTLNLGMKGAPRSIVEKVNFLELFCFFH